MTLKNYFKVDIQSILLTFIYLIGFFAFNIFENTFEGLIFSVVLSFILAGLTNFLSKKYKFYTTFLTVAFDAGGVYFQGDYFTEDLKVTNGFNGFLKGLRKNNKVVMLTNQNKDVNKFMMKKYNLLDHFDDVISSGDLGIKKPNKEVYLKLAKKVNSNPQNIVFFDDQEPNAKAASDVGLVGMQFKNLKQAKKDLTKLGIEY